ncbi:MAG: matrixin family metalloprotease [Vampirovibrio sp.]|nr:matrixin family metalloprotease [Vampirovibrio sp.]
MVQEANQLAGEESYPEAIGLYEQIVKRSPLNDTLKKNLAVLYFNYGVNLQTQKQYDAADKQFDNSLALLPQRTQVVSQAKAANQFYRAMDLKDQEARDYSEIRHLIEDAIRLDPNEPAFKKGLANALLAQANDLAYEQRFQEAIPLMEEAHGIEPNNTVIQKSLANVYLGAAMQTPDMPDKKVFTDKAISIQNTPDIAAKADKILQGGQPGKPGEEVAANQFLQGTNGPSSFTVQQTQPPQSAPLSLTEKIAQMETQMAVDSQPEQPMVERLSELEAGVYGAAKEGPVNERVNLLYAEVMGAGVTESADTSISQTLADISQAGPTNYIDAVFKVTGGKVVRWASFPLRVYIDVPEDFEDEEAEALNTLYKTEYGEAVLAGLNRWKDATQGFVQFSEVKNPEAADIRIHWAVDAADRYATPETLGELSQHYADYTPPKRTKLSRAIGMAAAFTPGYFALAPQAVNAAMQYRQYQKVKFVADESKIYLGLGVLGHLRDGALTDAETQTLLTNLTAHHMGHALGLKAESLDKQDIMHPENALRTDAMLSPSPRDLETLRLLYTRPANIVLNIR